MGDLDKVHCPRCDSTTAVTKCSCCDRTWPNQLLEPEPAQDMKLEAGCEVDTVVYDARSEENRRHSARLLFEDGDMWFLRYEDGSFGCHSSATLTVTKAAVPEKGDLVESSLPTKHRYVVRKVHNYLGGTQVHTMCGVILRGDFTIICKGKGA